MTSNNPLLYSHLSYLPVLEALGQTLQYIVMYQGLRFGEALFLWSHEWVTNRRTLRFLICQSHESVSYWFHFTSFSWWELITETRVTWHSIDEQTVVSRKTYQQHLRRASHYSPSGWYRRWHFLFSSKNRWASWLRPTQQRHLKRCKGDD